MRDQIVPKLHKWPFFLGDGLMLSLAGFVYLQSTPPMNPWEILECVFCVAAAAGLGIIPFLSEYRAAVRLAEGRNLVSVVSQIKKLEQLAAQIGGATSQWQVVQDSADKTATTAKEIAVGMASEVKGFNDFLQRANDTEKAALRLEVEKSRRGETEWLQALVRMLDHVYALHQAALRSAQPALIEQLGSFQNACRDAARRVGLTPYCAGPDEIFDGHRHQVVEGGGAPVADAVVEETLATGFTFQGRLLRPALVRLRNGTPPKASSENPDPTVSTDADQNQLPLGR
jgi:molecular chaperone GrpE (heat shock protein)